MPSDRVSSNIGPFAIVPDTVIRAAVSDRAVRLYALLARHADRLRESWPSRRTLAKALATSSDSVDRAIKELIAFGFLCVEHRVNELGDPTSNLYRLIFAQSTVAAPARPPSRSPAATGSRTPATRVAAPVRHRTRATLTRTTDSEESVGAEPPGSSTPPVLTFPTTGDGALTWDLTTEQLTTWQHVYPTLDVLAECRQAWAWTDANPTKRKTARGMRRFLVSWLNREVDGNGARRSTPTSKTTGNVEALQRFAARGRHDE